MLQKVLIPSKPKYIPNHEPPPKIQSVPQDGELKSNTKSHKVILARFLLANGNISFAVGTRHGGIVTKDEKEVLLESILDHVSPYELQRFENQDFLDEDIREALLPTPKARGRPVGWRKDHVIKSAASRGASEKQAVGQKLTSSGKSRGRPRKVVIPLPSPNDPLSGEGESSTRKNSILVPFSNGPHPIEGERSKRALSVAVPSFNGPQPIQVESSTREGSLSESCATSTLPPKPQYSMVIASGLVPSDDEPVTSTTISESREHSPELEPIAKRRRLAAIPAFVDLFNLDESTPQQARENGHNDSDTSPDPIASDSAALLRRFQAKSYRKSRPESSSSESLMARASRPAQTPYVRIPLVKHHPLKAVLLPTFPPVINNPSITSAYHTQNGEKKTTRIKATVPITTPRKYSLRPRCNLDGPAESQSQLSPQTATPRALEASPSSAKTSKRSPEPESSASTASCQYAIPSPSKPSHPPSAPVNSGAKHFAHKASPPKASTPKASSHKAQQRSPAAQPIDLTNSPSEDHRAKEPSPDSLGSEVLVVRKGRVTPTHKEKATHQARGDAIGPGSADDDSSDSSDGESDAGSDDESPLDGVERSSAKGFERGKRAPKPATPAKTGAPMQNSRRSAELEEPSTESDGSDLEILLVRKA